MATLLIATPDGGVIRRVPLDPRLAYSLGRSPRCSIPLEPRSISRRHGLLFRHDGTWWIADSGSTRGLRIESGATRFAPLTPERWIGIGPLVCWLIPSTVNVRDLGTPTSSEGGTADGVDPLAGLDVADSVDLSGEHPSINEVPSDYLLIEAVNPARRAAEAPRLIHLEGVDHVTIGSGPGCAVRLAASDPLRPLHLVVYREPRTWVAIAAEGTLASEGQRFLRKRLEETAAIEFGGYAARLVTLERVDPAHQGEKGALGDGARAPGHDARSLSPSGEGSEAHGGAAQRATPTAADLYASAGGSIFLQPSKSERFKAASNADSVRTAGGSAPMSDGGKGGSVPTPARIRPTSGETPLL